MSSEMKRPSKAIVCNREFADGITCGRPVSPVYGCTPEECTTCASRILTTKAGFAATEAIVSAHYSRLRELTIAASVQHNPWAVKDIKPRFAALDKLLADIGSRKLMRAMGIAARLSAKDAPAGKLVTEPRRSALGYMWNNVSPERAIELKQGGFETRFIGVSWQVKVS
jgi:hypothetical protein